MAHTRKTFVTCEFSLAYLDYHDDDEFCCYLPKGTMRALKAQFAELEVPNRDVAQLAVPKGVLRFRFYDRLVEVVTEAGEQHELRSAELNRSPWHYCGAECTLYFHGMPARKDENRYQRRERRDLLRTMRREGVQRLVETHAGWQGGCEKRYVLDPTDVFCREGSLRTVDGLAGKHRDEPVFSEFSL